MLQTNRIMIQVVPIDKIRDLLKSIDVVTAMEEGFVRYSNGEVIVPPVGELLFAKPPGDVHIKYGYIKGDVHYVIKIASGFYENAALGLPSSNGMMLLFDQKTGAPLAVLLDEGLLTDVRTAAAGALAAKYFAPKKLDGIGILGTGIQARLQLHHLRAMNSCKTVWVWGRRKAQLISFQKEFEGKFNCHIAESPAEVANHCNLIVTTTPSQSPLLLADEVRPGTHITAVGSDTSSKQELDSELLGKADKLVADSLPQSESRGEIFQAVSAGRITREKVVELGQAIQNVSLQRENDHQLTIVDLTGVAVQDIMITKAVYAQLKS